MKSKSKGTSKKCFDFFSHLIEHKMKNWTLNEQTLIFFTLTMVVIFGLAFALIIVNLNLLRRCKYFRQI